MDELGNPSEHLIYDIGDLGETELVMELSSSDPSHRTSAVMEVSCRLSNHEIITLLSPLKARESNMYTLRAIDVALQKVADKEIARHNAIAFNPRLATKIAVIGCAGSGKSYLAKELAKSLSLPCYHLDVLFWKPNWVETPIEEFSIIVDELVAQDKWVIDGNYYQTMGTRFINADIVFFLDMPTSVCLQSEKERRGTKRSDLPEYLEEKEDQEFLDWIKNFKNNDRNRIIALMIERPDVKVATFSSREEVDKFLDELR